MTPLPRFLVIVAILVLPARLLGQVGESSAPLQPAPPAAASLSLEHHVQTEENCDERPWWHSLCRFDEKPSCCQPKNGVFIFGGLYTTGSMGHTFDIFNVPYDGNFMIGAGYQRYHWTTGRFHWGWELGGAGRWGSATGEIWGGPTVRHEGVVLANCIIFRPALTAGFSAVSEPMGREIVRQFWRKGDATFLYYLGPDFAFSTTRYPNIEVFYRLHHRCGGGRTLGNLSEGNNANTVGIRFRF